MRILQTVEQFWPSVGGMQEVVRQLSELLVSKGHQVVVATSARPDRTTKNLNGIHIEEFEIGGNAVDGYRWGDVHRYQEFLRNSDFDIIINFAAQQWATDLILPLLREIPGRKVFVPTGFSGLYDIKYREYFCALADQMLHYDANIFLSNDYRDIQFARERGIGKKFVIPNGASESDFLETDPGDFKARMGIADDSFLILTVGSHNGMKGHLESLEIFNRSKLRNATLLIVGDHVHNGCGAKCEKAAKLAKWSPSLRPTGRTRGYYIQLLKDIVTLRAFSRIFQRRKIIVKSLSRADTICAFKAADLFLFCSAIECSPIVLFESAAAGTPFLTTEVGNTRELIKWLDAGWLLPTRYTAERAFAKISESVHLLEELASNPELLKARGAAGRQRWRERFTWALICDQYEKLFEKLVSS